MHSHDRLLVLTVILLLLISCLR